MPGIYRMKNGEEVWKGAVGKTKQWKIQWQKHWKQRMENGAGGQCQENAEESHYMFLSSLLASSTASYGQMAASMGFWVNHSKLNNLCWKDSSWHKSITVQTWGSAASSSGSGKRPVWLCVCDPRTRGGVGDRRMPGLSGHQSRQN